MNNRSDKLFQYLAGFPINQSLFPKQYDGRN